MNKGKKKKTCSQNITEKLKIEQHDYQGELICSIRRIVKKN